MLLNQKYIHNFLVLKVMKSQIILIKYKFEKYKTIAEIGCPCGGIMVIFQNHG